MVEVDKEGILNVMNRSSQSIMNENVRSGKESKRTTALKKKKKKKKEEEEEEDPLC